MVSLRKSCFVIAVVAVLSIVVILGLVDMMSFRASIRLRLQGHPHTVGACFASWVLLIHQPCLDIVLQMCFIVSIFCVRLRGASLLLRLVAGGRSKLDAETVDLFLHPVDSGFQVLNYSPKTVFFGVHRAASFPTAMS